jgi:hypothetical protein
MGFKKNSWLGFSFRMILEPNFKFGFNYLQVHNKGMILI